MTKKDQKAVLKGALLGIGFFLAIWFARKPKVIPEISPVVVNWKS